jgi:hypothetical protein
VDFDERRGVLVTALDPLASDARFCVRGWFSILEAKTHPEWVETYAGRPPAWFVPQEELLDFGYSELAIL